MESKPPGVVSCHCGHINNSKPETKMAFQLTLSITVGALIHIIQVAIVFDFLPIQNFFLRRNFEKYKARPIAFLAGYLTFPGTIFT